MSDVVFSEHIAEALTAVKQYTLSELLILSQAINAEISNLQGGASYAVFTGATSNTGGASGFVPAPQAGDDDKFLCGNGQWVTLQGGETYSDATTVASGLMSASDKVKLNGIDTGANNYTLPTASSSTKGGIKVGTGLSMNGDTLNCTVSGGGVVLSTVSSTTPGAMWLSS